MSEITAEQATIGAVILRPDRFADIRGLLVADDFDLPANRVVFEAMDRLASRGIGIDPLTVEDELRTVGERLALEGGPQAYLNRIAGLVPLAENVSRYTEQVAKRSALRKLKLRCAELSASADNGSLEQFPEEAQRIILESQRLVTQVARGRSRPGVDVAEIVSPALREFESRQEARAHGGKLVGLSTGVTALDYLTGGFRRGTLNIIGARTSLGKTAFACQVALVNAIKHGIPVIVFSLEMTPMELIERFFARWAKVDSTKIRTGELTISDWHALNAAGTAMSKPGLITISNTRTLAGIMMEARGFRVRHANTDVLVVVDYLQIVRTGDRGRTREQEVAEVSSGLKETAVELDCPVVSPAQLNRGPEAEERDPKVSDLRESGAIENDADTIMFIVRKRNDDSGYCYVPVLKNRNGATGEVEAVWHGATYELKDAEEARGGN